MFKKGSYDFECQLAHYIDTEQAEEKRHHAMPQVDARQEMVAARREQQRLSILRYLHTQR